MNGFQRWRWQVQDAELEGELACKAGKDRDVCQYKRKDMVEAWQRGYSRQERRAT